MGDNNVNILSDEEISLDSKQKEIFEFICTILPRFTEKFRKNRQGIINMCISLNNSYPIADYIEQLTSNYLTEAIINSNDYNAEVYMSGNEGRTDHDRKIYKNNNPFSVLHLDNKGVRVKPVWKAYKIEELKDKLRELGHHPTLKGQKKWEPLIEYIMENNLLNNGIDGKISTTKNGDRIEYNTILYSECNTKGGDKNDHPDQNFHMKCSQSNLSGFSSTIEGSQVSYNGLIPTDVTIPHFTFILKHIYSEDHGIHKLVLIAVPHCSIQNKYFPDIQKCGERVRMAKAKDEFRFNMNDSEGNPYTFLGSDIPRFTVFNVLSDINYV